MNRDDLLTLLRAWGWSQTGWANRGAMSVWKKGKHTVHTVRVPMRETEDTAETAELLAGAMYDFATAEAPRLLAVVREVAALHQPEDVPRLMPDGTVVHDQRCTVCLAPGEYGDDIRMEPWHCPTAQALSRLEENRG